MIDEELILFTLAERMTLVRWTRSGDAPDARRFITVSRRLKMFSEVPSTEQAACFQAEWGTTEDKVIGMPYKAVVEANWVIFQCVAQDAKALGAVENNLIIGGCRKALEPDPVDPGFLDKRNTLNGLVYNVKISGRIFKDPGDIDGQGMLVIPIKVLVP